MLSYTYFYRTYFPTPQQLLKESETLVWTSGGRQERERTPTRVNDGQNLYTLGKNDQFCSGQLKKILREIDGPLKILTDGDR